MANLSTKLSWEQAQPLWASQLNPVLSNPITSGQILAEVSLKSGDNTINHLLGQKLQGYIIVRNNSPATFYDKQSANQSPALTLVINASQACVVSILVF